MTFLAFLVTISCSVLSGIIVYAVMQRKLRSSGHIKQMLKVVQDEIAELVGEVNSVTDRNITMVDDRMKQLRLLLRRSEDIAREHKEQQDALTSVLRHAQELSLEHTEIQEEKPDNRIKVPEHIQSNIELEDEISDQPLDNLIVSLYYSQGLSAREIASELSISETEVETALLFYEYKHKIKKEGT